MSNYKFSTLANSGNVQEALSAYNKAQRLDLESISTISAKSWNNLCWFGSLNGSPKDVLFACEKAVALASESDRPSYLDSRGVARAMTGNKVGAIADFQAFIDGTDNNALKTQRQQWIKTLSAGRNPFTPQEIERLLK